MKIFNSKEGQFLDLTKTMYPSYGMMNDCEQEQSVLFTDYSNVYGFVLDGYAVLPNGIIAKKHQYFSFWNEKDSVLIVKGKVATFIRIGFKGQDIVGGPIEESGRLCYIDGCSDSLLVYPPRLGDPSLNVLYFRPHINQSFHIHPSIRLGVVVKGHGYSCIMKPDGTEEEIPLIEGTVFCIEERELHRFRTEDEQMIVIPYHPDGDWGPTDHNHTMLNRTYLSK
jgi:hypothetical protein